MQRWIVATVLFLGTAMSSVAKVKTFVGVKLDDEKAIRSELQTAIEAQLNSMERYETESRIQAADLVFEVDCVSAGARSILFVSCNSVVTYFPYQGEDISSQLGNAGGIVFAERSHLDTIINGLVRLFVNGTTEAALNQEKRLLTAKISQFCSHFPKECTVGKAATLRSDR